MLRKSGVNAVLAALLVLGSVSVLRAQDTSSADKKFIEDSTADSLVEINLAKLALQKSQDKNVRAFAERMIHDHEMLIASMKPLAAKLGAKLPTSAPIMGHVHYDELKMNRAQASIGPMSKTW